MRSECELSRVTRHRRLLAVAVFGIGVATLIAGYWLESRNPRSSVEDTAAWGILGVGMFLLGVGATLPFARLIVAVCVGIVVCSVAWWLLVIAYWIALYYSRWPAQQEMVSSGYRVIPEAKQIDELFGPAWHKLSNYQEPDIAEWQTEALIPPRYELSMWVPVRVDRNSGQVTEVIGKPQFRLVEVAEIRNSREVQYKGDHPYEFGLEQWHRVVGSQGDFSAIGIQWDRNRPVPGFDSYKAAPRNGIQMRFEDAAALPPAR
jgi:hypothetical protein